MPNRRYRNRRYRKRYNRRLSKSNILLNKGSRSQAKQILALNRKVNRVYRATKPEIKFAITSPIQHQYTSAALSSVYTRHIMPLPSPQSSTDTGMDGDKCSMKSFVIRGYAEYYNSSDTGYHNSESAGCIIRIIAVQPKQANFNVADITLTDLLQDYGDSSTGYTALSYSPFKRGTTTNYRILMDYKTKLTTNNNQKLLSLNVPLGRYRDLRYNVSQQNWANVVIYFVAVSGLHYDSNFTEYVTITHTPKMVYTDA
ncbi:capsid protein [Peromfec virus RodF5_42]|uniref:Capsid protein n=2 Tax=Cressdnaviricota TaxID=2732416 RepID=A0A976N2D4_9VIRU|nr:capsid protein [Peromfec virus RodF7_30]UPW41815.1 capsid protein [Peromfec virus RodF5_42]